MVAFNAAEGWARDVTEDIARAVLSRANSERRSIGIAAQDFVVRALGRMRGRASELLEPPEAA